MNTQLINNNNIQVINDTILKNYKDKYNGSKLLPVTKIIKFINKTYKVVHFKTSNNSRNYDNYGSYRNQGNYGDYNSQFRSSYSNNYYGGFGPQDNDDYGSSDYGSSDYGSSDYGSRGYGNSQINPSEIFLFDEFLLYPQVRAHIKESNITNSIGMNLDKFIVYSLYLKSPKWFSSGEINISKLKEHVGKDVSRFNVFINNKKYEDNIDLKYKNNLITEDEFNNNTDFGRCDNYILQLMDIFTLNGIEIDLDLINKICALTCQNTFNFVTELINLLIISKVKPEVATISDVKKAIYFTLKSKEKTMKMVFESKLIISHNLILDPEIKCGKLSYELYIDFNTNTYEFKKLHLKYDVHNCDPSYVETHEEDSNGSSINPAYAVPAILISGGLISLPFVLPMIAGKKRTKRVKHIKRTKITKNKKNKKTIKNKIK